MASFWMAVCPAPVVTMVTVRITLVTTPVDVNQVTQVNLYSICLKMKWWYMYIPGKSDKVHLYLVEWLRER